MFVSLKHLCKSWVRFADEWATRAIEQSLIPCSRVLKHSFRRNRNITYSEIRQLSSLHNYTPRAEYNNSKSLLLLQLITKDSFSSLHRLQSLNVQHLPKLERFDSDSLLKNVFLQNLKIQTWPKIEKYRFRLSSILGSLHSLKKVSVDVQEVKLSEYFILFLILTIYM